MEIRLFSRASERNPERMAYALMTRDRNFIESLSKAERFGKKKICMTQYGQEYIGRFDDVSRNAEFVRLKQLSLVGPEGYDPNEIAKMIAGSRVEEVVEEFEMKRVWVFSDKLYRCMQFSFQDIDGKVEEMNERFLDTNTKFEKQPLYKKYFPF